MQTREEIKEQIEKELKCYCQANLRAECYDEPCSPCAKEYYKNKLIEARKTIAAQRESIENFILGEREE